jgi:archaellin
MEFSPVLILALCIVFCVLFSGCVSDDAPPPVPAGGDEPQAGVLIHNVGDVTGQGVVLEGVPRGTIDTITFTIGLVPGIRTIDLNNLTVIYADAVRTEVFTPVAGYRGNPPAGYWGIISVLHELGNPNMRLDYEEEFVIRINPRAPVVPNQVITISVKPDEGKPLIIRRIAPSTIVEPDNILSIL